MILQQQQKIKGKNEIEESGKVKTLATGKNGEKRWNPKQTLQMLFGYKCGIYASSGSAITVW